LIKDNIIVIDSIVNIIPIDNIIGMLKDSENNILVPTKNNIAANPSFK
jgi:3-dehydroquinate synthase class II